MADIVGGLTVTNLPADPATGARQDGSNALLSTIDGHVDSLEVALGNSGDAPAMVATPGRTEAAKRRPALAGE